MSNTGPALEDLTRGMIEENIVKFGGPFRLKGWRDSVAYVNLRDMISIPRLFGPAVDAYVHTLEQSGLSRPERYLDGIPETALYYAGAVAYQTRMPLLQRRINPKTHGEPRLIEGRYSDNDEVVLLDDVVTNAQSKFVESYALGHVGLNAVGVIVLVDRQQGGRTQLETQGLQFAAALTLRGIARYALDEGIGGVSQGLFDDLSAELDPNEV